MAGSDHCFHTCCPYVHTSVRTFQNLAKQNMLQLKTMFTTGEILSLAEWIIDDYCLIFIFIYLLQLLKRKASSES